MSAGGRIVGQQISSYCQNEGSGSLSCGFISYGTYLLYGFLIIFLIFRFFKKKSIPTKNKISNKTETNNNFLNNYFCWAKNKSNLKFSVILPLFIAILFCLGSLLAFVLLFLIFSVVLYFLKREIKDGR